MSDNQFEKMIVVLPRGIVESADWLAQSLGMTRDDLIAELIAREMDAHRTEGYREFAEANLRLAEEAFPLASGIVLRNPWP